MDTSLQVMSDVILHMKYAKYLPKEKRRETWQEVVTRNMEMHIAKYPHMEKEIRENYKMVYDRMILPSMRALANNTPLPTPNGYRTVGEIGVGDTLFDSQGRETRVLEVYKFESVDLYDVCFSDGSIIRACDEHLWIVETADDMKTRKNRVVNTRYIKGHLTQGGKHSIRIRNCQPVQYTEKELPVDPYLLGLWLGDGFSNGTQYTSNLLDVEHMKNSFESRGIPFTKAGTKNIWAWNITSFKKGLEECNLVRNKHIPDIYFYGSVNQRLELIAGLVDTDGHIDTTGRIHFSNTNVLIIDGLRRLLSSVGLTYTLTTKEAHDNSKKIYTVCFFTTLPVSHLPRRAKNLRQKIGSDRTLYRRVTAVQDAGNGGATCFLVDSEDHSFLAGENNIVTHNCLQFSGRPMDLNNTRGFNCAYMPMDSVDAFSETMFLLLGGSGVGFSVQKHHTSKLPLVRGPLRAHEDNGHKRRYLAGDHIEGWADCVKMLMESYFYGKKEIEFDLRDIRPKGSLLVTAGGKAPGPQPLKDCLHNITKVLDSAIAERGKNCRLSPIEVHDIMCHIADAVLAGGIRRSAMISFFGLDDEDMLYAKSGNWWELNPQRGRANNSAVLVRHKIRRSDFDKIWGMVKANNTGEPGIYLTHDKDMLANPCQPAWAKVLTKDGIREFRDIKEGMEIWSAEGWTKVLRKWSTGVKKVYRFDTTAGAFFGTGNHKVVSGDIKVPVERAQSIERIKGPVMNPMPLEAQDIMDGIVLADGYVEDGEKRIQIVSFDQEYLSSEISHLIGEKKKDKHYVVTTTLSDEDLGYKPSRRIPQRFITNPRKAMGLLRGLFSSLGSIAGNRICLQSRSKDLIDDVQMLLNSFGIGSYYTTHAPTHSFDGIITNRYEINIRVEKELFMSLIGFIQTYKKEALRKGYNRTSTKKDFVIVGSRFLGEEEVFDITVDNESHTYWTQGCNVSNCVEASLKPMTFCNLVTMNASSVTSQEDFEARCKATSFISTLQAGYTDFHYLRDDWRTNTEKDALLGISMTGIASKWFLENIDLTKGAEVVLKENERVAKLIGINKAARTSLTKPDGTASILLGTSSGIHAWYAPYYIRRVRIGKYESLYQYMKIYNPDMLEDDLLLKDTAIINFPIKAPVGAITREESSHDLLERVKKIYSEWIVPGHRRGSNTHNTSVTVSVKPDEWESVGDWMWENREFYNGISVLPHDSGTYVQPPFEEITEEVYNEMLRKVNPIDLSLVFEAGDNTDLRGEVACGGGACEIK